MFASTTGPAPEPPAALAPSPDQAFAFHQASNPELWRTTLPLIVRLRCGRHKGLIATWLAIHWLSVLYSAGEDVVFGVREIAQEAGVGRNELAGPGGHIQRLLALGLIQIVGTRTVRRGLRPCPVYHIDLPDLERQSIAAIQELLRTRGLPAPPRPAPDPRQLALFDDAAATTPRAAQERPADQAPPPWDGQRPAAHPSGTGGLAAGPAPAPVSAAHRPDPGRGPLSQPETGTVAAPAEPRRPPSGTGMPETGTGMPETGTASPATAAARVPIGTVAAPNRDIERKRERETEGVSARAPDSLLALATAAAQAALQQVLSQLPPHTPGVTETAPPIPPAPAGEPPLPAPVLDLWAADRATLLQRDRFQLEQLAAHADAATGGHGAYWLGRAILMAEACLEPRGQRPTVTYLRALLRRWQREGSWGSDLAEEEADALAPAAPARPAPAHDDHPAIAAYAAAFGRAPNAVQAQQIRETVSDHATWRRVLTDWQANGWKEGAVANMLDRYRKEAGAPPDDGPPVSVSAIHRHPGLSDTQRDQWIRKFHAATTPAEKRAVLSRLAQEHPR